MNIEQRNQQIVSYINQLINRLSTKYSNMNFDSVANNAISSFTLMSGTFEEIKIQIDKSFAIVEQNIKMENKDNFEMTDEELQLYEQLKAENLAKRNAMKLYGAKKLQLSNSYNFDNRGYINFLVIMGIILTVIVTLIIIVCNVIL